MTSEEFLTIFTEYAHNVGSALWDLDQNELETMMELAHSLIENVEFVLGRNDTPCLIPRP